MKTLLLVIDPQNDFMDIPGAALPVPGANGDMSRLAGLVSGNLHSIDDIVITMDSHQPFDIAHPGFWLLAEGGHPSPYGVVTLDDVSSGRILPANSGLTGYCLGYLRTLADKGIGDLSIWPEHCLVGTWGHCVQGDLSMAVGEWSRLNGRTVTFIGKGTNPYTEHFSAVKARVPYDGDQTTCENRVLLDAILSADRILVAGEALSHCVADTIADIAESMGDDILGKIELLSDCSSPVVSPFVDFPAKARTFVEGMKSRGMSCTTSSKAFDRGHAPRS